MDLIGREFGQLIVKELCKEKIKGKKQYLCICSCGSEIIKTRNVLITGNSKSCGHTAFTFDKDKYIGKTYNQLTCLEYIEYGDNITGHYFNFKCSCGEIKKLPLNNVKSGNTKHCGCKYTIKNGQKFGELTVIEDSCKNEFGHLQFLVECSCGKRKIISRSHLVNAQTCGHLLLSEDEKIAIRQERSRFTHFIQRIKLFERDNNSCFICNKKQEDIWLHSHHLKVWKDNSELRFCCKNLITLCQECHIKYAHDGNTSLPVNQKWLKKFEQYLLNKNCICKNCNDKKELLEISNELLVTVG